MRYLLKNASLIDGKTSQLLEAVHIEILDDEIKQIHRKPLDNETGFDKVLDVSGKTVMPGIINCHCHLGMNEGPHAPEDFGNSNHWDALLSALKNAEKVLKRGVTAVQNVGHFDEGVMHLRDAINRGLFKGPRILCSGQALAMTGGHGTTHRSADGVDEILKAVRLNNMLGADVVKVMATGGMSKPGEEPDVQQYEEEEMRVAFREGKKRGMKCNAHCHSSTGTISAIKAGVDIAHHCNIVDDETLGPPYFNGRE